MKRCTCCAKEKPESDFSKKQSTKDGLNQYCRKCQRLISQGYRVRVIREMNLEKQIDGYALGGIRINILNHAKQGEHTFNLLDVNSGKGIFTNDQKKIFSRA